MAALPLMSNGQLSNTFARQAPKSGSGARATSIRDVIRNLSSNAYTAGSAGNQVGSRGSNAVRPTSAKARTEPMQTKGQGESQAQSEDYLSKMRAAADAKTEEQGAEGQSPEAEADSGHERVKTVNDPFMAMFERYSADNLDNMSLGDFLQTDGSQEDRDMWRAFTSDPMMSRFYSDAIDSAGGFDPWYDQMTGVTIDDIMADPNLQYAHFGGSDDTVHSIHDWASQQGWMPDVSGSGADSENLRYLFESDPSLAASVMDYMFGMNALNNQEDVTDVFSLGEMNDLLALDGLEYGYGNGYDYGDHSVPDAGEQFLAVDPEFWAESLEKGWSSVPGYGLSNRGAAGLMREKYDAGYARRPGVDDAYAAYGQQQGGDQQ